MQLLRDNLTLWTTDMPGDNDNAHNEVQDVDDDQKWLIPSETLLSNQKNELA